MQIHLKLLVGYVVVCIYRYLYLQYGYNSIQACRKLVGDRHLRHCRTFIIDVCKWTKLMQMCVPEMHA